MAYELAPQLHEGDTLTLIGQGSRYRPGAGFHDGHS